LRKLTELEIAFKLLIVKSLTQNSTTLEQANQRLLTYSDSKVEKMNSTPVNTEKEVAAEAAEAAEEAVAAEAELKVAEAEPKVAQVVTDRTRDSNNL